MNFNDIILSNDVTIDMIFKYMKPYVYANCDIFTVIM